MTTTGQPVTPGDDNAYAALLEIYREQAEALLIAGVDLFAVETMMGVTECMAAVEAIRSLWTHPFYARSPSIPTANAILTALPRKRRRSCPAWRGRRRSQLLVRA